MQSILQADTSRIFADWGQPAVLEEVESYYDPDTGQLEDSILSTPVLVLTGVVETQRSTATAASHPVSKRLFLIQATEVPLTVNLTTARIVSAGVTYRVEGLTQSHIPETIALHCVS